MINNNHHHQLPNLMLNGNDGGVGSYQNFEGQYQPERLSDFSSTNFKTPAFFGGGGIPKEMMKMQDQEERESQEEEEEEEEESEGSDGQQ